MITKLKIAAILGIIYIATTNFRCNKGCSVGENTSPSLTFVLGVKAYPDKDSIRIGDTLWLEIYEPTHLKDINTDKIVSYSNAANLGSAIGFGKYPKINTVIKAANDFKYILKAGTRVKNPKTKQIREFLFVQQGNRYVFKLGIIPKDTGTFGVGFSNAQNVYRKNEKCTKAYFMICFKNTKQHFYLNPNIRNENDQSGGSYFFKVY